MSADIPPESNMDVDEEEPVLDIDGERKLKTKRVEEIEAKLPDSKLSNREILLLLDVKSSQIKITTPTGKRGGKDWKYFDEIMCKGIDQTEWSKTNYTICKPCYQNKKFTVYRTVLSSGKNAGTGSLANHINSVHKGIDNPIEEGNKCTQAASTQPLITKHITREGTLTNKIKDKLTHTLVVGLALGNRPYNMLNDIGFRLAMKAVNVATVEYGGLFDIDHAICEPSTASRRLETIHAEGIDELKSMLNNSSILGISITSDHWKGGNKKYFLSFTISYSDMDKEYIVTRYICLEFVDNEQNLTTTTRTKKIVKDFALEQFELSYTTDNAMEGSYEKDQHNACLAHSLALFHSKSFYNSTTKSKPQPISSMQIVQKINRNTDNIDAKVDAKFLKQYSSNLHLIDQQAKIELKKIIRCIMLAKMLVSYLKHSGLESQLNKRLQQECDIRWDMMFDMIKSITDIEKELKEKFKKGHASKILNLIDFEFTKQFQDFLKNFKVARLNLSKQSQPSMVYALATCYRLYGDIDTSHLFEHSKSIIMKIFKTEVLDRLNATHVCASIFSPFGLLVLRSEHQQYYSLDQTQLSIIERKLLQIEPKLKSDKIDDKPKEQKQSTQASSQMTQNLLVPRGFSMSDFISNTPPKPVQLDQSIVAEFRSYLNDLQNIANKFYKPDEEENLFFIWKSLKNRFPKLYQASTIFLSIQATQTVSERIFKRSKLAINSLSNQIATETVDRKLFIYHNPDLFVYKILQKWSIKSDQKFHVDLVKEVNNRIKKEMNDLKKLEKVIRTDPISEVVNAAIDDDFFDNDDEFMESIKDYLGMSQNDGVIKEVDLEDPETIEGDKSQEQI